MVVGVCGSQPAAVGAAGREPMVVGLFLSVSCSAVSHVRVMLGLHPIWKSHLSPYVIFGEPSRHSVPRIFCSPALTALCPVGRRQYPGNSFSKVPVLSQPLWLAGESLYVYDCVCMCVYVCMSGSPFFPFSVDPAVFMSVVASVALLTCSIIFMCP